MSQSASPIQAPAAAGYRVSVQRMVESHQITYVVCLDRPDRPLDAKPWDPGRITPYRTLSLGNANCEAEEWAQFLDAPFQPLLDPDAVEPPPGAEPQ